MIGRSASSWQTVLADLSLILFMVTASALGDAPPATPPPPPPPPAPAQPAVPALGEPVALWRDAPGAPPLKQWLAQSAADPRLRLTILAAPEQGQRALALAAGAGRPARIVLEPGRSGVEAALVYDRGEAVARGLQTGTAKENLP